MELLQLKYFCDAAQSENFSKTAKKFLVPTSNISQSVKRLERELGVELFEHRANKIALADAGKRFYEKTKLALEMLEDAKNEVMGEGDDSDGEIKLLVFCNRRLVTEAIEKFKRDNPRVSFVLRHELEADIDYDILISDSCPHAYSERFLLAEDEILLAIKSSDPLCEKEGLTLSDLKDGRFISMPRGRSLFSLTNSICQSAGFTPNVSIQTDDPFYIRKYVEMGLGIAFIPSCSWEGLFSDNVVLRDIGGFKRKTYVFLPPSRKPRGEVTRFLRALGIPYGTDA
ncbi:MAG: LysR family transcriptional regulator [Clostridia bacterium]|nr:LysR family transcriptional regulator [Clostridia bacterium]